MSLASDYFAAYCRWHLLRCRLDELIVDVYRGLDIDDDDVRLDYYDSSIEIWRVTPTASAWDRFHEAGFAKIWLHPHPRNEPDHAACGCQPTRPT